MNKKGRASTTHRELAMRETLIALAVTLAILAAYVAAYEMLGVVK